MKDFLRRFTARLFEFQTRRLMARRQFKVVGVSGAAGKTSTKLAIATVLEQKYRVLVQWGSFNDEIGLPLACFDLPLPGNIFNPLPWLWLLVRTELQLHRPYPYEVLVIEIGTDAPGEVPHTLTYLRPDIGVVTAVMAEHMEYFADLEAVAAEELALAAGSAVAVVNRDDVAPKYWDKYVAPHPKHYSYGLGEERDYGFILAKTDPIKGTTGRLVRQGKGGLGQLRLGLYGRHSAKMAAAAYAVGDLLGLTAAQLQAGVLAIRPAPGRMNPLRGIGGSVIIDDSYNSSPESARAALEAVATVGSVNRRFAILGSMNELGEDSQRYHEQLGRAAAAASLDFLVTTGELANKYLGPAALAAGLPADKYAAATSPYAAAELMRSHLGPGDLLLVKGSQNGVFTEEAVRPLLADPADAKLLVRQAPAWQARKRRQFPDAPKA
ncbi:MAG TPA: Mur ligase family protein [Candidatus Saccharimonadia bacterium]|nr:Mur ligase family protein [Candidatus Saccharimonadia bacterium]